MSLIHRALLLLSLALPVAVMSSSPSAAAARHYDCSKPGNATKSACKYASPAVGTAAKPSKTTTTKATTTTTTRHYDCTKRGNATKAVCRAAAKESPAGQTAGAVVKTSRTTSTTTDCSKLYNKLRAVCRTSTKSSPSRTSVAPAAKPVGTGSRRTTAASGEGARVNSNPNGAIATCRDGMYSHAAHRAGACSRHGGVSKWMAG
jgi:hypothetical protein